MLVYGDPVRIVAPRQKIDEAHDALSRAAAQPAGIGRHGDLVAALIAVGELLQGLADAQFAHGRHDDTAMPGGEGVTRWLMQIARAVWSSWQSGFACLTPSPEALPAIDDQTMPATIEIKLPEGFAFYAVYPEAYAVAALESGLDAATRVIGLRSIGTTLSAMVAAALHADEPVTVRPVGHPFERTLAVSDRLKAVLFADPAACFAVVDEGPGLSGSSFGAVADMLTGLGVPEQRVVFFPSHEGLLGAQASDRRRASWERARREVVDFDRLVLRASRPEYRLERWVAEILGPLEGPLEEVSGGWWRSHQSHVEADWPPASVHQERRKFLVRAKGATWLIKFVGLGSEGMAKVARARRLHAAGFTPKVAGFCHGFIVERWVSEARPLDLRSVPPELLASHVGRYLADCASFFPVGRGRGASLSALQHMARHNTEEALGSALAARLDRWSSEDLARLSTAMRPVETDNRLHRWEWLVGDDGRMIKCDAIDHANAHDLIGCQDIAWDAVGAAVELAFDPDAQARLRSTIASESGRVVDEGLVAFLTPCYLAFQLGAYTMAAEAAPPSERSRLQHQVERYAGLLRHELVATDLYKATR